MRCGAIIVLGSGDEALVKYRWQEGGRRRWLGEGV